MNTFASIQMDEEASKSCGIVNVWKSNMHTEIDAMSDLITDYPVVALDTEFPGVVIKNEQYYPNSTNTYNVVRGNVERTRLIQAGFSLFSKDGLQPPGTNTWQFNFEFTLGIDPIHHEAFALLKKAGINFDRLSNEGVDRQRFAERMLISGLLLNPDVKWLTFQGGFDFAYLLKLFSNLPLPLTRKEFDKELKYYFCHCEDLCELRNRCSLRGGLQTIADKLEIERKGVAHQAGSDSMITGLCFFKMRQLCESWGIHTDSLANQVHGLGC
uniref:poly(A)-specific ribonuclease n=1 Tax=Trichuris muris TaxID=70415 RepID=A0A5S6QFF7_TRIMR